MTATDRFKWLLANALERVCVLEEQLELRDAEIERLQLVAASQENGQLVDEPEAPRDPGREE